MKKIIWAVIAIIPFTALAGSAKWIHGHGIDAHHEYYQGTFEDGGREVASMAEADKDYDTEETNGVTDSQDTVYDRGNSYSEDPGDWTNDKDADRPPQ